MTKSPAQCEIYLDLKNVLTKEQIERASELLVDWVIQLDKPPQSQSPSGFDLIFGPK